MSQSGGAQSAVESALSAASASAPAAAPAKKWVSAVTSRISTKWIGGIATVLILGATAAFGGLEAVAVPPTPEIAAGDTFAAGGLELTPQRAVLIDELNDTGVRPQEGERLLIVVLDVTNTDDDPRTTISKGSVGAVRVDGHPDAAPIIVRYDDSTLNPVFQPDVPAQVVVTWAVPSDAFADGDDLRLALPTATKFTGEFFVYGDYWDDVAVGAYATLAIEDIGAGATQE